jgi:hypothetical protein
MSGTGFITNNILTNLINFLAPVVGICLVIFCVVQAVKIFSGSETGSVKKLIGGVLILLFIIGIMYAAGSFQAYGNLFKNLTDTIITDGAGDAEKILK